MRPRPLGSARRGDSVPQPHAPLSRRPAPAPRQPLSAARTEQPDSFSSTAPFDTDIDIKKKKSPKLLAVPPTDSDFPHPYLHPLPHKENVLEPALTARLQIPPERKAPGRQRAPPPPRRPPAAAALPGCASRRGAALPPPGGGAGAGAPEGVAAAPLPADPRAAPGVTWRVPFPWHGPTGTANTAIAITILTTTRLAELACPGSLRVRVAPR